VKTILRLLLAVYVSCSFSTNAADMLVVEIAEPWAKFDGTGYAVEVFDAVQKVTDLDLELSVFPFARAIAMFKQKQSACYLGGDEQVALDYLNIEVIASEPFYESKIFVFTLRDQALIEYKEQLQNKRVGINLGVGLETLGLEQIDFQSIETVASVEMNYKKLKAGRIDAFLAYQSHLPRNYLKELNYSKGFPIYINLEKLACHPSQTNKLRIQLFNEGLREIRNNGLLNQLFKKYFIQF